jgi:hypothetical protein
MSLGHQFGSLGCDLTNVQLWKGLTFDAYHVQGIIKLENVNTYKVQRGYHEPNMPPWVIAYWVFILGYFKNILNNFFKILILKKKSSHYYVMVHIKNLLKICHCQKNSSPFTSPLIIKNIGDNVFKMFFDIFHSLN